MTKQETPGATQGIPSPQEGEDVNYRINEAKRVVEIHSIRHRRDAYRS